MSVTNTDDDAAGMTVTGSPVTVSESGTTGQVTLVLQSAPSGTVTVAITGLDASEASLSTASLTFTPANWNTPQSVTVTGVDDVIVDGDVTFALTLDPSGADYNSVPSATVSVTNTDDDAAGIIVSNSPLTLQEFDPGISGDLVVVLTSEPTGPVTVTITGNDPTEASLSTTTLTFTPADWFFDQVVTANGVNDNAQDGDITFDLTFTASGADYGATAPATGTITTIDDDSAAVFVSGEPVTVSEQGTTGQLEIVLVAQPSANVTITVSASDATEASVNPQQLIFTPANWSVAQAVTVTGVNDQAIDGDIISSISFTATSADVIYNDASIPDATVTTVDDDIAGFAVNGGPLKLSESGSTASASVKLTAQPLSNVVFTIASSDLTESSPSPTTMTFTPANWDRAQKVVVVGIDDTIDDGDIASTISIAVVPASSDPAFAALAAKTVATTTTDNDESLNDDEAVRRALTAQTHNFMANRNKLIASHSPALFRLANRDAGARNGFQIDGDPQSLKGDFALSAAAVRRKVANATIEPVADVPQRASTFDAWIEGQFAVYNDNSPTEGKGNFFVGYAGVDMRIYENAVIGLMGQFDWTDDKSTFGKVDGKGWMIGPYVSLQPTENLFLDLRALWGNSANATKSRVLGIDYGGDFETERVLVEGRVSGAFAASDFTVRPDVAIFWMREQQDDYKISNGTRTIAVNGQIVSLGEVSTGLNIARGFDADGLKIEPFVAGRFTWTFDSPGRMTALGSVIETDDARAAVSAGVNIYGEAGQFRFEATYDGLFSEGLDSWGGKLEFQHQF